MNFTELHKEIDKALLLCKQFLERNLTQDEMKSLRQQCGVPETGTHYNTSTMRIYNRVAAAGFKDEAWDPPASQGDRLKALKGKNWKDGFFMVKDGEVHYPYIDKGGEPEVSGVRASSQRAGQQNETTVANTAGAVMDLINKHKAEG
jgi:hypothetical protein